MFSSTAYEAYYTYIGLYLHDAAIKIITSQAVFTGLIILILALTFMLTTWRYFSKYFPSMFGRGRSVSPTFFVKLLACFLLAMSLLRASTPEDVKNMQRQSWADNPYVSSRLTNAYEHFEVSFAFSMMVRSAEELGKFAAEVVDHLFATTNSQLKAPSAFYRAVIFASAQAIDDPELAGLVDSYTHNCFDQVLPLIQQGSLEDKVDELFRSGGVVDRELETIPLTTESGRPSNCLELKELVRGRLLTYAQSKGAVFSHHYREKIAIKGTDFEQTQKHLVASHALVNHYLGKTQDALGNAQGSKVEGTLANVLLGVSRFFSFDGFLSIIGQNDKVGAALTAERAKQFSEYLQRAPHLKGMVKLFLIAVFPWLVFFVVAGKWKVIVAWFALYGSVMLWTPIWSLLYHLMTSIALSTDLLQEFGRVNDGISLYASTLISAKLYQFYAIYSWLQVIVGPLPTLLLGYGLFSGWLSDKEVEQAPGAVMAAKDVGISAATGGASSAAHTAIKKL